MRAARGNSPLISYVVRPRSTVCRRGAPVKGRVLYTRHTNPEQSNPPREVTPKSVCRDSDVPPQTYG
jgi:hypothetical protein